MQSKSEMGQWHHSFKSFNNVLALCPQHKIRVRDVTEYDLRKYGHLAKHLNKITFVKVTITSTQVPIFLLSPGSTFLIAQWEPSARCFTIRLLQTSTLPTPAPPPEASNRERTIECSATKDECADSERLSFQSHPAREKKFCSCHLSRSALRSPAVWWERRPRGRLLQRNARSDPEAGLEEGRAPVLFGLEEAGGSVWRSEVWFGLCQNP